MLDDYHVIESPTVHETLAFLLTYLPDRMHLVFLTRAGPALPLSRLRAQNRLTEIRAENLRFTFEETSIFLKQIMGLELCEGYIALARLQLAQGDLTGARQTLQDAGQLRQRVKIDLPLLPQLDECHLRLWLATGNLPAAAAWAQTSGLRLDDTLSCEHYLPHINLARVLVAQGVQQPTGPTLVEALRLLDRLLAAAGQAGWIHDMIRVLVLQAIACRPCEDHPSAYAALGRALELAEPGGYWRVFIDEGEPMKLLILDLRLLIEKRLRSQTDAGMERQLDMI